MAIAVLLNKRLFLFLFFIFLYVCACVFLLFYLLCVWIKIFKKKKFNPFDHESCCTMADIFLPFSPERRTHNQKHAVTMVIISTDVDDTAVMVVGFCLLFVFCWGGGGLGRDVFFCISRFLVLCTCRGLGLGVGGRWGGGGVLSLSECHHRVSGREKTLRWKLLPGLPEEHTTFRQSERPRRYPTDHRSFWRR